MFAGCILLSGSTALLVNCVEPYGRLKSVDAHHERRTSSSIPQSLFPKSKSKYGQIEICLTHYDNTTKLKIGATSCNLIVTSSVRLDKQTIANKSIELVPNTGNFIPLPDARIYLNLAHGVSQDYLTIVTTTLHVSDTLKRKESNIINCYCTSTFKAVVSFVPT